jgi:hypothetical protein
LIRRTIIESDDIGVVIVLKELLVDFEQSYEYFGAFTGKPKPLWLQPE